MLYATAAPRLACHRNANPGVVIADWTYSAASNRTLLRHKRIRIGVPEWSDQVANRDRKGCHGGRARLAGGHRYDKLVAHLKSS